MKKLLNKSLRTFIGYAAVVLVVSIPVYYVAIRLLWQYEMNEHNIVLSDAAARHDQFLIIAAVTLLTALFFLLLLGGFILMNKRISRKIWQPFYNSIDEIRRFDLHKQQSVQFEQTDIEEFSTLNKNLQALINSSITAYRQQKEFIDNASHELQTPLAIVQSKLEMLLQSQPLTSQQYQQIEETIRALGRISRINKNLLLLSKIENSQYSESEQVSLSGIIDSLLQQLNPFIDDRGVIIEKQVTAPVTLVCNPVLIEILLTNLLINAIRYSKPGSTIQLQLQPHSLLVQNPGPAALQADQLFKRFASANPEKPGTGLGLAIVKEICLRYGWQAAYDFERGNHRFLIRF